MTTKNHTFKTVSRKVLNHKALNYKTLTLGALAIGAVVGGMLFLRPNKAEVAPIIPAATAATPTPAVVKKPIFVQYHSIDDAPTHERKALAQQAQRLARTGSTSGGELTFEFKQATHAKMTYRFGRKQRLTFKPITPVLPAGFVLTGRQYEGKPIQVEGRSTYLGWYRLFENPDTKARIEISETQLSADAPIVLYRELMNETLANTPVQFETLHDKKGVVYHNAKFAKGDRLVQISSKGVAREQILAMVAQALAD
ncbi:Uncharacterised protein [Moraxella caviae]|nr:hypothetical protein [Moraxella caviae]STZ14622.1 Uncharacterised protein [Moraxella caviae]VEW11391.1 Uncharacterised protein [Moraxella caviae]